MSLSQTITPELRQWIIDQASAGVAAPALIEGMRPGVSIHDETCYGCSEYYANKWEAA